MYITKVIKKSFSSTGSIHFSLCIMYLEILNDKNDHFNYSSQREVTTHSQTGEEIVPALTLHFLITQLEMALRNIQASNYTVSVLHWMFACVTFSLLREQQHVPIFSFLRLKDTSTSGTRHSSLQIVINFRKSLDIEKQLSKEYKNVEQRIEW